MLLWFRSAVRVQRLKRLQHWTRPTHQFIDDGLHNLSVDHHRQEFKGWEFMALNKTHSPVYWWRTPHPVRQEFKSSKTESLQHWTKPIHRFTDDSLHILSVDHHRQEFKSSKTESLQHWMRPTRRFTDGGLHVLSVDHHRQEFKDSRVYSTERDPLTALLMMASMSSMFTITDKSSWVQRLRVYSIEWDPLTGLLMMASTSSLLTITDKSSGNPGAFSSSYSTDRSASLNDTKQHLLFMKMNTHLAFGSVCISAHKAQPRGCHVQNENKHV